MPKYVIERTIPGVGAMAPAELHATLRKSSQVLHELGPQIQWQQCYITGDKTYCVYIAPDADLIREHARKVGLPADSVSEVVTVVDPATAE